MPFITEELEAERIELEEAVIANKMAGTAEPPEAATADESASSPRFGRWIMLSLIALTGSVYLLTDDDVMHEMRQKLDWAREIEVCGEVFQVPASARTRTGTARFTIDVYDIR